MQFWKIYSIIVEGGDDINGHYLISFKVIAQSREKALSFLTSTEEYRLISQASIDEVVMIGISWLSLLKSESARIIDQTGKAFFES
jgi:hypothetical protein